MTGKQRRHLRALAHGFQPIVQIGQRGLTENVLQQVDRALTDHELIKVKLGGECPLERRNAGPELARRTGAELAGSIGRTLLLYRPHPENPRIRLPDSGASDAANLSNDEEASHEPL